MRNGRLAIVAGNIMFFFAGPVLEAGVGPWLLVAVAGSDLDGWPPRAGSARARWRGPARGRPRRL